MKKLRKIAKYISIILVVIIIVSLAGTVSLVRSAWPDYKKDVKLESKLHNGEAEVYRDQWGVPQIYAKDNYSLFFVQGYVQAQDRLWQMEMNRIIGNGELSKYFGNGFVELDYYMRTIGLKRVAESSYGLLNEETKENLNAYVDGVNAYLEKNEKSLPVEFKVLGVKPDKWNAGDVLTTCNIMVTYMSYNYLIEIMRAKIVATLGEEAVNELFLYEEENEIMVPEDLDDYRWLNEESGTLDLAFLNKSYAQKWGSNNWVINGEHTKSGKPILCNDTHISLSMPSMWYEMGLHSDNYNVSGYSLIGAPYVVIGHNDKISWGITNVTTDVQDLYVEKLDDIDNPKQYYYKDEWHDLKIEKEKIEVKESDTIERNVYYTEHGPLVNEAMEIGKQPISMKWTLYDGNTLLNAVTAINQAGNWSEFREGLREWNNAAQNFVYADVYGNIGYQNTSKVPIREKYHQGLLPVPGWTGTYEWKGYVPYDELPSQYNPEEGHIVTANNKTVSNDYEYYISDDWSADYRVSRIKELLSQTENATIEEMERIQLDTYSIPAEKLVPYFINIQTEDEIEKAAIGILKNWDYKEDGDSAAAAIFEVWYNKLVTRVINDNLNYRTNQDYQPSDRFLDYADFHYPFMIQIMNDNTNHWFDLKDTEETETRDDLLKMTLKETMKELKIKKEKDLSKVEWGKIHSVTLRDSAFGSAGIGIIEKIFNSSTYGYNGGNVTINVGGYGWEGDYSINFGTSQRMIIDMNDFDNSVNINSSGEVQQIFHKNREDQTKFWTSGEYKTFLFSKEKIESNSKYKYKITY